MSSAALSPPSLPASIVDAWTFVHGAHWHFEALPAGTSLTVEPALALTVALRSQDDRPSLLVGCLIRYDEAVALARHMFDPPDGEVTPDDVRDAGQEACNVLAGSVIAASPDADHPHIGLPQVLTAQQYQEMREANPARACFVGHPLEGGSAVRVVLTLFDLPSPAAVAPHTA